MVMTDAARVRSSGQRRTIQKYAGVKSAQVYQSSRPLGSRNAHEISRPFDHHWTATCSEDSSARAVQTMKPAIQKLSRARNAVRAGAREAAVSVRASIEVEAMPVRYQHGGSPPISGAAR